MSGGRATVTRIPKYVKAATPDGLRRMMLRNSLRMNAQVPYFDIQQANDGTWYAWFLYDEGPELLQNRNKIKKTEETTNTES